jgi:energy-coupling factor transporter transmembrane protein EcfT
VIFYFNFTIISFNFTIISFAVLKIKIKGLIMIKKILLISCISLLSNNIYSMGSSCNPDNFLPVDSEQKLEIINKLLKNANNHEIKNYLQSLIDAIKREEDSNKKSVEI